MMFITFHITAPSPPTTCNMKHILWSNFLKCHILLPLNISLWNKSHQKSKIGWECWVKKCVNSHRMHYEIACLTSCYSFCLISEFRFRCQSSAVLNFIRGAQTHQIITTHLAQSLHVWLFYSICVSWGPTDALNSNAYIKVIGHQYVQS